MAQTGNFSSTRRKPRIGTLVLVGLFHVALFYGLAKAFAPDFTGAIEEGIVSTFSVTVTAPPEEPPPPDDPQPEPDEGAQGDPGREAVPREVSAPEPPFVVDPSPVPRATSTGTASTSGATESGTGTGAAGTGEGTGSGEGGSGQGGLVAVSPPVKIAGDINASSDYPIPPGGRQARRGHSVTVAMTVGVDGRPSNCRVVSPSPFPESDRITCELAVNRFRFRPATNRAGDPVPATYGWRQRWF